MDPLEHDSLMAAALGLPTLLGVTSFYSLSTGAGWGDLQRLTNTPFARLTQQLHDTHPDDLRDLWIHSRSSLVQHLDALMDSMQQVRTALAEDDRATLEGLLSSASEEYSHWINRRHRNQWDEAPPSIPKPGIADSLIGGYLGKRLRGENNDN
jgi:prephenate dehydrogenase